tara:strand:- start:272 stop:445 length:174 start_codon:yes stop_codon:yes gene_type:complete
MEEKWEQVSFSLRHPLEAMVFGYEFWEPDENVEHFTFSLHFWFVTLRYEWGFGESPF